MSSSYRFTEDSTRSLFDKQWKNHEQSKKHRDKVAEFRESIGDDEFEDVEEGIDEGRYMDDGVESIDDLEELIRDGVRIDGEEEIEEVSDENEFYDFDDANVMELVGVEIGSGSEDEDEKDEEEEYGDDELGVLEAMVSTRKKKKNETLRHEPNTASTTNARFENDTDEAEFMGYNN